ncbi:lipoprotein-attachment site-containing protein [Marinobacter sp. LV10R510-11A]|uniref:LPS translocon maturation chaperone LptM n=1 Tax=Marinobacter sp. LV10R510-11A TaxID=1415568 RepID=UPI000BBFB943|nr:lipoprotein [Marinobacter sp. LV10R510-11A]SOB76899.1 lipoprotein-attachment site-containing protein [Marinobacter sp. LV10R510-11A]
MRAWTLPVVILVMAAALGGCGQKGALYRDNPEASSEPAGQATAAGTQNERPDDRNSSAE